MRKRLWTTSEAATQIALEKSGREGRKEGGSAAKDGGWRRWISKTLHHSLSHSLSFPLCTITTAFAEHTYTFFLTYWGTAAFWLIVITCTHTHTHANTFEVSDERTPTSMVGLWKRVCRRDKSVMQQMPACNNPSCQLWSSLNTHSYSMFRSHVTFSYTFCMERHIEDIQYRKTVVTGLTDGKWPVGGSSAQRMTTADSRFMYQKSPKQTSTSWCNQRIRHLILSIQHISICF